MDADKLAAAKALRDAGQSHTQIAKAPGISSDSVYRHLVDATPDQP
jgi:DNA-binding phage protein